MPCTAKEAATELEFVQQLCARRPHVNECCGPLLTIAFPTTGVFVLEHILDSGAASDLLWDGFLPDRHVDVYFRLCAGHWIDLTGLCVWRAKQFARSDWHGIAENLMNEVCQAASWDAKEIANMFAWQRLRLT